MNEAVKTIAINIVVIDEPWQQQRRREADDMGCFSRPRVLLLLRFYAAVREPLRQGSSTVLWAGGQTGFDGGGCSVFGIRK